jgi:ATP-dependent exoDNAse (exonuclease V) alpha subunit
MSNRDLAVAIAGKPGAGKSRAIAQASAAILQATGAKPFVLARAVEAVREAAAAEDAMTVDRLRVDPRLQKEAAGRVLFCDEASFLDNARAEWLLTFARDHHCRVVFWGDPRQHDAVERGTPFADLLDDQTLARADLEKIYRQTNPQLLAAVEDYHARRLEAGFDRLEQAKMIRERDTEAQALQQLVEDSISFYKKGQDPLVIALRHSHGDAIAAATRQRLKAEGLLDAEDHLVTRLERVDLTDTQRSDPVCYQPGQIVQFHRLAEGGFKSGKQYEVKRVHAGRVMVQTQDDQEKPLPLHQPKAFQVYRQAILPIAVGERVMVTQNNARRGLYNGDLVKVQKIEGHLLHLDNHRVLDASPGLHLRQGYSVSSQASQGHQCDVTPGLSAGKRRKPDRRQTNDRHGFSGSRTIAHLHRFNRRAAGGCYPFRRPGVRNRAHPSGSRKTVPKRAGN